MSILSTLSREVKSVHGPTLSAEHLQVTNDWNTETLTREIFKIEAITQQVLCSILAFVWKEKFFSISDCVPTYLTYLNLWWSWNIISNKYEGSITERLKTWSWEREGEVDVGIYFNICTSAPNTIYTELYRVWAGVHTLLYRWCGMRGSMRDRIS